MRFLCNNDPLEEYLSSVISLDPDCARANTRILPWASCSTLKNPVLVWAKRAVAIKSEMNKIICFFMRSNYNRLIDFNLNTIKIYF